VNKIQQTGQGELLERLKQAQHRYGYLPEKTIARISKALDIPIGEVYGTATFYSFLAPTPQGRNIIRVCKSLPCFLKNYGMIIETIANEVGIKPGETTPDGRFSFQLTNCIGACDKAPAMMINSNVHTDLTPGKIAQILQAYK
jgi:NADH-quinone oxidoreductase subunit E